MDETATPTSSTPQKPKSKMLVILGVVVGLLILAGAAYFLMGQNTAKPSSSTTTMEAKTSPTPSSLIGSIKDALSKSMTLSCDYTDDDGRNTMAYIKSGAVRADINGGKTAQENGSMLMTNNKMYFWSGKQGIMMAFDMNAMMEEGKEAVQTSPSGPNGKDMMENLEKFKENCKPAVVDDKLFVVPSDVTFQDMSKMMPSGVMTKPSGTSSPSSSSGYSEEDIKKMMQQYANPPSGQ